MKKFTIVAVLFVSMLLGACSGPENGQLTRVDVQKVDTEGNYEEAVWITDTESINRLNHSFEKVKWEPGVEAQMARKEDVLATLFYTFDENMPEKLFEYRIWFNSNGTATIISDRENEGYGTLDKEGAVQLKKRLSN